MRGYVPTPWGQAHYRAAGESGPALLLFHETPLTSEVWEPALPHLGRALRAFAFDTPGYGLSDAPPAPASIRELAAALVPGIDALGLDRFAVCGSHTGASLALELAALVPERVTHAVLTGVPLMPEERAVEWRDRVAHPLELRPDGSHLQWAWKRWRYADRIPLELVNLAAVSCASNHARYHWGYLAALPHDCAPLLSGLRCPTLLLNTEHDSLAFADGPALELLARGERRIVASPARKPHWEDAAEYAAEVVSFVTR